MVGPVDLRSALHRQNIRLHLVWLAAAPAVWVLAVLGGLAYVPLSAPYWDDPCCHVQVPGLLALAWGGGSLWFGHLRRKEFNHLLGLGGKASFQASEKRLEALARQLPSGYRARLRQRREELRQFPGRPRRRRDDPGPPT